MRELTHIEKKIREILEKGDIAKDVLVTYDDRNPSEPWAVSTYNEKTEDTEVCAGRSFEEALDNMIETLK